LARCFQVNSADNVATSLDDAEPGFCEVLGRSDSNESERLGTAAAPRVALREPIKLGHKVALADIATGEAVVKFGVPIGRASVAIRKGQWVHLHNCASFLDERSQTLDVHSGATTDTVYE